MPPSSRKDILQRTDAVLKKPPAVVASSDKKRRCNTRRMIAACFVSLAVVATGTLFFFFLFAAGSATNKYDIKILVSDGNRRRLQIVPAEVPYTTTTCAAGEETDIVHTHGASSGYTQKSVDYPLLTPYGRDTVATATTTGESIQESSSMYHDPQFTFSSDDDPAKTLRRPVNFFRGCDTPERYFSRCPNVTDKDSCQYTCGIADIELDFRKRGTAVDDENNERKNKFAVIVVPMINYIKSNKQVGLMKIFLEEFPEASCNTTAVWRFFRADADPGTFEATILPADHPDEAHNSPNERFNYLFKEPQNFFVDDSDYVWNAGREQWVGPSTPD